MAKFLFYDDKIVNILIKIEKPAGGAATQTLAWIRGLLDEGQEICVMTRSENADALKDEYKNIKLIPLYEHKPGIRKRRSLYNSLRYLYCKIKEQRPDYIFVGIPGWESYFIAAISKYLKIKMIQRISSDAYVDGRHKINRMKIKGYLQSKIYTMVNLVVCQNDYQVDALRNVYPHSGNIVKIYNPYYSGNNHCNQDMRNSTERKYIAWIGLFHYPKNIPLLYDIASTFEKDTFKIAGTMGTSVDDTSLMYIEKLKLLPNVEFVGFLDTKQIVKLLSGAKYLLNTSYYEGFSNTFLEAMSVGTPIMTSRAVNPDAIVEKYKLGIVYDTVNDLKSKYIQIGSEQYEMMSGNAKKYVYHNHDHRRIAKQLLDILGVSKNKYERSETLPVMQ